MNAYFFRLSALIVSLAFLPDPGGPEGLFAQEGGALHHERSVPIPLDRFYFTDRTDKLKPNKAWIFSSPQELLGFYLELMELPGIERAQEIAQSVDFKKSVIVLVVGPALDACRPDAEIIKLERAREESLQVTVQTPLREPCHPGPLPKPHKIIGTSIERPVKNVTIISAGTTLR